MCSFFTFACAVFCVDLQLQATGTITSLLRYLLNLLAEAPKQYERVANTKLHDFFEIASLKRAL